MDVCETATEIYRKIQRLEDNVNDEEANYHFPIFQVTVPNKDEPNWPRVAYVDYDSVNFWEAID